MITTMIIPIAESTIPIAIIAITLPILITVVISLSNVLSYLDGMVGLHNIC